MNSEKINPWGLLGAIGATAIGYALALLLGATYWSWMGYLARPAPQ